MTGDKLRFRFAKTGTLRLLSHHDLMRCLERMLRRADVPFKSTAGFHPGPRVVFAQSLPLGVVGRDEVVEIELTRPCDADDTLARLNAQAPAGLSFTRVSVVQMKATAIPRRVIYELPLPADRVDEVAARIDDLLAADKLWVERVRPSPKRLNVRPYVRQLIVKRPNPPAPFPTREGGESSPVSGSPPRAEELGEGFLALDFWVTQTGTARAEELIRLLGLADLLDAGAVLERTRVEVRDEVTNPTDFPPDGPADALPMEPAAVAALLRHEEEPNQPAGAHWGASPSGPVVE
jgi:radical SAM-linked protein